MQNLTFVNAFLKDKGCHTKNLPQINSHIASYSHTVKRSLPTKPYVASKFTQSLKNGDIIGVYDDEWVDRLRYSDGGASWDDFAHHARYNLHQIPATLDTFLSLPYGLSPQSKFLIHYCELLNPAFHRVSYER